MSKVTQFEFEISNNPQLTYFPGQPVSGALVVTTEAKCETGGIRIEIKGKARVRWLQRQGTRTSGVESKEDYIKHNTFVLGDGKSKQTLAAGSYRYPFKFVLPTGMPSSFVGKYGFVRYQLKAVMQQSGTSDLKLKLPFTVNGILDLNNEPGVEQAVQEDRSKDVCCFCCRSGPIGFVLTLPRNAFVPGEYISINVELNNESNRRVTGSTIELMQKVAYRVKKRSRFDSKPICSAAGPAVASGKSEIWEGNVLRILPLPPTKLVRCGIIDVEYVLKLEMKISGCASSLSLEIPIIIGTIPLKNFPVNLANSTDQVVQLRSTTRNSKTLENPEAFLLANYPNLPVPSYEELVLQDTMDANAVEIGLRENSGVKRGESSNITLTVKDNAAAFIPKYITYG